MTAKINKTCRLRDENQKLCRRPKEHHIHNEQPHGCQIAMDRHHTFLPAWRKYGEFKGDPFVRTSVYFRKSMLKYLRDTYGSIAVALRGMVFEDMALPERRRRWLVGEESMTPEKNGHEENEEPVV